MLRPYQEAGAKFLATRKRALLADEMGLGKSAQAIEACRRANPFDPECRLKLPGEGVLYIGVVCPASLRENWRREFDRFWPNRHGVRYELCVESYDKVRSGLWKDEYFDVIILDEAHYLKSRDSKRTAAILGEGCMGNLGALIENVPYVFALTGTPTPNNSAELWPLLRALAPDLILAKNGRPMNYWQFAMKFCNVVDNGFGMQIKGNRNTEKLREMIAPFVLRRKKADVLQDLPSITFDTLPLSCRLAAKALKGVEEMPDAQEIAAVLENARDGDIPKGPQVSTYRRHTGLAKIPAVVEWLKDWLESGGEKIVVFAHHREVMDHVEQSFPPGVLVAIAGDTPPAARQAAVDAFQNNPGVKIFLGQIQAAGTGITLTAASEVLFAESSWVPSENTQAAARIHRIGQKNACLVRFATLAGSLDERIQMVAARKAREVAELFD